MEAATASGEDCWEGAAGTLLSMSPGSSLSVVYHSLFGSHDDLLLLEVDEHLLPEMLDQRVTIRGQPDEDAVLCTASATYALKFVGTSNTVCLVPPGNPSSKNQQSRCNSNGGPDSPAAAPQTAVSVLKVASGNMELVQVAPRLDKLKSLLRKRPYRLEEDEDAEDMEDGVKYSSGLYRWDDLVNMIQASDEELMAGLRSLSAVEINGYWRVVSERSMDDMLRMLLNNSMIQGWKISELKEDEVVPVLVADGFPHTIVLHCLGTFGLKKEGNLGDCVWELDEKRVCLHFAKQALSGGKMKLGNFMEKWISGLPHGMQGDLEMLQGEVLYETLGVETWVHAFSVSDLPSTPADRFAALFQERPKWAWKDLQAYVRDLRVPGLSSEALLIKYTRRTQPTADAEPIFSAR
ncbi:hypothetical protein Taro_028011 [Colocasia esculenta]|uniref:Sister chromatid cohesion protein DCC1 n=1 Tax=Colocasia esculenta TaxID=4460 RepID=A0A843VJS1_COLES|nr:hypothetical protein [Colocasia esculenta]